MTKMYFYSRWVKCCAIADSSPLPCICQVTQKYADILYTLEGHLGGCTIHKGVIIEGLKCNQPPDLICNIHQLFPQCTICFVPLAHDLLAAQGYNSVD